MVRTQPFPRSLLSVSYSRPVHPPLKRTTRVRFPSPIRTTGLEPSNSERELAESPKDRSFDVRSPDFFQLAMPGAVRAGHRCSSFLQSRRFDSVDCYFSRPAVEALHAKKRTGSSPARSTPLGRAAAGAAFSHPRKDESPSWLVHSDARKFSPGHLTTQRVRWIDFAVCSGTAGCF